MKEAMAALLLAFGLSVAAAGAGERTRIALVTDSAHFPYAYLDGGHPAGLYVDIVQQIVGSMTDFDVTIEAVPWKRALHMVSTGAATGIFPPHKFLGQRDYLEMYSHPILEEYPVIYCSIAKIKERKGDTAHLSWPSDFTGFSIGVPNGVRMGGDEFWTLVETHKIVADQSSGAVENLRKLAGGRVDCLINDRMTVRAATARLKDQIPGFTLDAEESAVLAPEYGYLALGCRNCANRTELIDFMNRFNDILDTIKKNGELDRIVERYLSGIK